MLLKEGIKKEDVQAALKAYEETTAVVQEQAATVAAQSTGALVEALVTIKGEADVNLDISQSLQGEVSRFKTI